MRRNALFVTATLAGLLALSTLAGCSREKLDWKSAESADTVEGYDHFIERHPDSALATQARTRVAQLNEDRDWKKANGADTAEAYRQFLAQHENGKWSEEARIRIENFALDGTATGPAQPVADAAVSSAVPAAASAAPGAAAPTPATTHGPHDAVSSPAAASVAAVVKPPTAATAPAGAPAKPAHVAAGSTAEPKSGAAKLAAAKPVHAAAAPASAATGSTAKPAAAGAAAAPAAAAASQFGVQLGAFRSQDAALKNWKQLQTKYDSDLHGLFAHAVPVKQTAGQLFRLQAPVGAEARARAICASLSKQSQPCVVVLPQP
jgi:cell division septation protein DedD